MSDMPKVAPYESCIACFRGDTETVFGTQGEAEWHAAVLVKAGIPSDQATQLVVDHCEDVMGVGDGMVSTGRFQMSFRLCEDCAARMGLRVSRVPGDIHIYIQPEDT